ncbi:GNAT family N-acetyltransferase [Thermosipho ferrireducens]|uniref:GNAT family N-acetyltransferase n=1 Tax=Thermosipho ferrireducens TaxID=2571116 RepID=A0ABX7S7B6_9BACT|nr:GNAT family N-acetyltransferase [Thermosipho ferrireducens]QTA38099.1 GNAT family N-acetyltransferase [Thermosipho ferrireducens]
MEEKILTLNEFPIVDFVNLVNRIFQDYTVPVNWNVISFQMDARENSISLKDSFVFLKKDTPVGFIVNSIRRERGRIDAMGVVEKERGTGLAVHILAHTINHLKWRGIKNLSLEVIKEDKRAFRFYEKNGFRITRNLHLMVLQPVLEEKLDYNYFKVEPRYVYSQALELEFSGRKPNWQREPITLLLSNGRYNFVRLTTNKINGYLVWGKNSEGNVFIVDIGTKENWDDMVKVSVQYLKKSTNCNLISVTAVPENDPLYNSLLNNGFKVVLTQCEMLKQLQ